MSAPTNDAIVCDDCKDAPATTSLFVGSHGRRKLDLCEGCADERSDSREDFSRADVAMLGGDPSL